jgi:hypothetical protein
MIVQEIQWRIASVPYDKRVLMRHVSTDNIYIEYVLSVYNMLYLLLGLSWPWSYCQLYRHGQFYWWRKPHTCRKSLTSLMLYTSPWSRFELTTSVVINTDCIGSCKSNYHRITPTTTRIFFCITIMTIMTSLGHWLFHSSRLYLNFTLH